MKSPSTPMNHGLVFALLVILLLAAVGVHLLHFSVPANNLVIFAIALVMSGLVASQYMNLTLEGPLVVWITVIPLVMFGILLLVLLSDSSQPIFSFLERGLKKGPW